MAVLNLSRRLNFDQAVAAGLRQQQIGTDQHTVVLQGGFKQGARKKAVQGCGGIGQTVLQIVAVDQQAARIEIACHFADLVSGGKTRLGGGVYNNRFGPVDVQPQPFWALAVRKNAGFGETGHEIPLIGCVGTKPVSVVLRQIVS